jgi:hypothetical protein
VSVHLLEPTGHVVRVMLGRSYAEHFPRSDCEVHLIWLYSLTTEASCMLITSEPVGDKCTSNCCIMN